MTDIVQFRPSGSEEDLLTRSRWPNESAGFAAKRELRRWVLLRAEVLREIALSHRELADLAQIVARMSVDAPLGSTDLLLFKDALLAAIPQDLDGSYAALRARIADLSVTQALVLAATVEAALRINLDTPDRRFDMADLLDAGFPTLFMAGSTPLVSTADPSPGMATLSEDQPISGRARIVSVLGMAGGVGATSVALNLARHIVSQSQKRVVVVDLDIKRCMVTRLLGIYDSPTVVELAHHVFAKGSLTSENIGTFLAHDADSGVDALLAPHNPTFADPTILDARLYRKALDALSQAYDVVILDLPTAEPGVEIIENLALAVSDELVAVLTPSWGVVHAARLYIDAVDMFLDRAHYVLNRYDGSEDCLYDHVVSAMDPSRHAREDSDTFPFEMVPVGTIAENKVWARAANAFTMAIDDLPAEDLGTFDALAAIALGSPLSGASPDLSELSV